MVVSIVIHSGSGIDVEASVKSSKTEGALEHAARYPSHHLPYITCYSLNLGMNNESEAMQRWTASENTTDLTVLSGFEKL